MESIDVSGDVSYLKIKMLLDRNKPLLEMAHVDLRDSWVKRKHS